jgi:hypothetical protein
MGVKLLWRGWFVDNNNKGARMALRKMCGRECLIVCLWGYAAYLNDSSTLLCNSEKDS